MAKEAMSVKIEKAIQSATNDFDHWVSMEAKAWEALSHASEVQSMMSAEEAIKSLRYARMNKEIANGKLASLRSLQK